MAGGQSELERRAASIAAESMAALVAHHDTDGDSGDHSTAGHGASAFRKSASLHAAPASAGQIMKRMKIHASSTPAVESAHASPLKPAAMKGETCATNEPGCAPRRSSGSDSDGTSSSAPDPRKTAAQTPTPARKVRVRKPTYAVRKEEKDVLVKEIHLLEAQVAFLNERAGRPVSRRESNLGDSLHQNDAIREALRQQQLSLARSQSAMLQCLSTQQTNPMSSYIRLGKTWHDRRATLLALKDKKLRDAHEYVMARAAMLDPLKPHVTDERFENAAGDYCCVRFEVMQFTGVSGVKQVYDALRFYLLNMEVMISETLGHVTTREDYDLIDKTLSNHRLLSTEHGVELELNGVMFTDYADNCARAGNAPCGIVAVDFVDDDELYPYASSGRVRQDVSATCVITQQTRKKRGSNDDELVVVMTRGAFLRLDTGDVALSPQTQFDIRDGIARWGHAMIKCIHDILYPEESSGSGGSACHASQ